jgi:hypothetical protein
LVTTLAQIISEVRGAFEVGVEVLAIFAMFVELPTDNDGYPALP